MNEIVKTETQPTTIGFADERSFELIQRMAGALAKSTLVPDKFQNSVPNCMIALNMANRIGADPFMVMQNLYIVHGKPGWASQFLIASFNCCGRFSAIRYEFSGEGQEYGCRAWAIERSTNERVEGSKITLKMAEAEGWTKDKKSKDGTYTIISKWKTMSEQMFRYRAAAFLVRACAPEIGMGLQTKEEIEDVERPRVERVVVPEEYKDFVEEVQTGEADIIDEETQGVSPSKVESVLNKLKEQ